MSDAHNLRKFKVKMAILRAINGAAGYLLPEPVLHRDLNLFVEPAALLGEFRGELQELQDHGLVHIVAGSLGGARKIKLTDAGRAEVESNL